MNLNEQINIETNRFIQLFFENKVCKITKNLFEFADKIKKLTIEAVQETLIEQCCKNGIDKHELNDIMNT